MAAVAADSDLKALRQVLRNNRGRFYTYVLCRPNGVPFYVGYGCSGRGAMYRVFLHEAEARARPVGRQNHHKLNIIRSIWAAGATVGRRIDRWFDDEAAAKAREVDLIQQYGRSDLGRGSLANLTDGGDGVPNIFEDGRRRMLLGQQKGRVGRALWAKRNPHLLRQLGKRLGEHSVKWMKENPEAALAQASAAGKIGGKRAWETIRSDLVMLAERKQKSGAILKTWMEQNPDAARNNPKRRSAWSRWVADNPEQHRAAGRKGGVLRSQRWKDNPAEHEALLRKAAAGRTALARRDPERMRALTSHAGSFNKKKADVRRRVLAAIAEGGLVVVAPSGRAGLKVWQEFEASLDL